MAFRKFHNEEYYEAPDINILTDGLNAAAQNMGQFFRSIGAQDRAQRQAADQFKFDIGQRKFESDDKIIREREFAAVDQMKRAIRSGDKNAQREAEKVLHDLRTDANASDIQMKRLEGMLGQVNKRSDDDKYYDKSYDEDLVKKAHGGYETYYNTRGGKIDEAEAQLFKNPKALKIYDYTADYIQKLSQEEKTVSTANPNAVNNRYSAHTFWDKANGAPGVTDQHAVNYLKSRPDGSVQKFFEEDVNIELDKEIQTMKKSGNPKNSWMNGKSDADIKDHLIKNPSDNTENNTEFGVRVRDKAKQQLSEQADIKTKVDVEYKKDLSKTGGLYNNDSIAYSPTFYDGTFGSPSSSGDTVKSDRTNINAAPGGLLTISKGSTIGKSISMESTSRNIFYPSSGSMGDVKGPSTVQVTGFQAQSYYKDGRPNNWNASNIKQLEQEIQTAPFERFADLEPTMSIAFNAFSVDKAKMLGDVRTSKNNIRKEMFLAKQSNNVLELERLRSDEADIDEFLDNLNNEDSFSDDDIINAASGVGINSIKIDLLIKGNKHDIDYIKTITEGLDLNKREKRSPEMNRVMDLYEKRYKEAQAAGFKSKATRTAKPKVTTTVPTGNIKVRNAQGQVGYIPAGQLKDALSQGYTEVK